LLRLLSVSGPFEKKEGCGAAMVPKLYEWEGRGTLGFEGLRLCCTQAVNK